VRVALYDGEIFNDGAVPILPTDPTNLLPLLAFISDHGFTAAFRTINRKLIMGCGYFLKVPFDFAHWQRIAAKIYPNGLPEPYSDDPTQWLFHGHPRYAEAGTELHVALARLTGYRWPAETDPEMRLSAEARARIAAAATLPEADADGLLALVPVLGERALADRLRAYCAAAWGAPLTPAREAELVRAADTRLDKKSAKDATLEAWLRDRAFRQHCALFHQRPFLWQVWDGLTDGFSAFLHYHRLDRATLEKLTYTLLNEWITRAQAAGETAREDRARQLQQRLIAILTGEAPLDIFVRWKPLARQPIGWDPDLDDGVRLNIRPFMTAGVLREQPKGITWGKDRGTDVASAPWFHLGPRYGEKEGARINDHHLSLEDKHQARAKAAE